MLVDRKCSIATAMSSLIFSLKGTVDRQSSWRMETEMPVITRMVGLSKNKMNLTILTSLFQIHSTYTLRVC